MTASSDSTPQIAVTLAQFVEQACVSFSRYTAVKRPAFALMFWGQIHAGSDHIHLPMAHARKRANSVIHQFSAFLSGNVSAFHLPPSHLVHALCWRGIDGLSSHARLVAVHHLLADVTSVNLLAVRCKGDRGEQRQSSVFHGRSLA